MAESEKIIVPTKSVAIFKAHLDLNNNRRILFSAPFGSGKSFFLRDFFSTDERLSLTIYPTDYSVASNEDIFELIKFDILSGLVERYLDQLNIEEDDISELLLVQEFARNRLEFWPIVKELIPLIFPEGDKVKAVIEAIEKQVESYGDFKKEQQSGEEYKVMRYMVAHRIKAGSVREDGDYVTALIKSFIDRLKDKQPGKPFVFIIDDLDRLDPEHVFRLFNVFTAHHDSRTEKNKFNFDQLIFVCDIWNIEHMFRHKYGQQVDFGGYIDKFYSSHIFHFNGQKYLKEYVKELILGKYNFREGIDEALPSYVLNRYDFKSTENARENYLVLEVLIKKLIDINEIKIRNFERFQTYRVPNYRFESRDYMQIHAYEYHFLFYTFIMQQFYPRVQDYGKKLLLLSKKYIADYEDGEKKDYGQDDRAEKKLIEWALPFIMPPAIAFGNLDRTENTSFVFQNERDEPMEIHYSVNVDNRIGYLYMRKVWNSEDDDTRKESDRTKKPNPYWFFSEAFRIALEKDFLLP